MVQIILQIVQIYMYKVYVCMYVCISCESGKCNFQITDL